jgi:hypothetical protein
MAYPPTQLTVTYLSGYTAGSGSPSATATATLTIPRGYPNEAAFSDYVRDIQRAGGFWTPQNPVQNQGQSPTFIPWSQIVQLLAS